MTDPYRSYDHPGIAIFGGVLAGIVGAMNLIYGILLLVSPEFLASAEDGLIYMDVTAWAWLLIVFGAVQIGASIGIISGQTWARLVGMAWASIIILGNMFALPAYPFFSIIIIALAVLILWSLASGLGRED